jgi:hypothetical protein
MSAKRVYASFHQTEMRPNRIRGVFPACSLSPDVARMGGAACGSLRPLQE